MTVYADFADKAAVFEAVVADDSARINEAFTELQSDAGTIDIVLTRLGAELMTFLMSPQVMRLDRMLAAEMTGHPTIGQGFYRAGPERVWQAVCDILAAAKARSEILVDNPRQASGDLIALWFGLVPLQHRFNERDQVAQFLIEGRVVHGVKVFMAADSGKPGT